ncbi:MAG: ATP phosphoribosyltransferase regulatory subunit [Clostridiales bacterium]|jgi:ATP phosphoribosyltransferase regulatory subunit|nr:ATP phosphoribosyltransferase regulatory subunit [Clostridiales bacterium]
MSVNSINIPVGTRDYLFEECGSLRRVSNALYALFSARGFDEVISPTFEYYDVVRTKGNPMPESMLFKFTECTGRLLALRPDMTTPIARIAATRIPDYNLPARLFYIQNVYRAGTPGTGRNTEVMQGGIELVGFKGIDADTETIVMAVDALRACTDKKFHIEIGHAGLLKELARDLNMVDSDFDAMRKLTERRNIAALTDMLKRYENKKAAEALSELIMLFGGVEVLDRAEALCAGSRASEELKYLRVLIENLNSAGVSDYISVDFGLVHQIDYYTGIIIRAYIEGAGMEVLSGGRYDRLAGSFGKALPAIGFAIDINSIAVLDEMPPAGKKPVLHVPSGRIREAFDYMDKNGPCDISPYDSLEKSREYAKRRGSVLKVIGDSKEEE